MFNAGVYADARARFGERTWRAVAFVTALTHAPHGTEKPFDRGW